MTREDAAVDRPGFLGGRWNTTGSAKHPDISGLAIEQHDHICVFNRGDQYSARRLD